MFKSLLSESQLLFLDQIPDRVRVFRRVQL